MFPRNLYAEELVRVSRNMEDTKLSLQMNQNALTTQAAQLELNEGARQKTADENGGLKKALSDNGTKLDELEEDSAQLKQGLEEVDHDLSAAEYSLRTQKYDETTAICQEAEADAEAPLATEKRMCQNLRERLQRMEREASEQLEEAERRYEAAKTEAETCERAKNDIEASLRVSEQLRQTLQQEINHLKAALNNSQGILILCFHSECTVFCREVFTID